MLLNCPHFASYIYRIQKFDDIMGYYASNLKEFLVNQNLLDKVPDWMVPKNGTCKTMAKLEILNLSGYVLNS